MSKSGIRVGVNKGHTTTPRAQRARHSTTKGKASGKVTLVREVIREAAGFAPYERRIMELIKMGTAASNKRALKFAKARLGTHKRGLRKRAEMTDAIAVIRQKAH